MTKLFRAGLVALLGFAVATPAALAGKVVTNTPSPGHMKVYDDAKVFHPDSVVKAETKFDGITFKSPTYLTVRTVKGVSADKKADYDKVKDDKDAKHRFMREWARELAQAEKDRGVFIFVCTETRSLEVLSDKQTDLYRHFDDADAKKVYEDLSAAFTKAANAKTEDDQRLTRGEGLVKATDDVIAKLKNTSAPEPRTTGGTSDTTDAGHDPAPHKAGMPWWGWVLIVFGVLFFIWIIAAVIRSSTGHVYGPGYMYGPGYGGGFGGGFFGGFLGGMFGAAAGMWMYNSMFGGHMYYDSGVAASGGGDFVDNTPMDTGAGDFDNGAEAGGDWDGGGDAGGGGGDWGGDAGGGGGDGGGGDWGGDGGGGDWGGGGDAGGGGGDFGGGGGDW